MGLKWQQGYGSLRAQGSLYSYVVAHQRHHGVTHWLALYHPMDAPDGAYVEVPGRYCITRREAMDKVEQFEASLVDNR